MTDDPFNYDAINACQRSPDILAELDALLAVHEYHKVGVRMKTVLPSIRARILDLEANVAELEMLADPACAEAAAKVGLATTLRRIKSLEAQLAMADELAQVVSRTCSREEIQRWKGKPHKMLGDLITEDGAYLPKLAKLAGKYRNARGEP